MIEIEEKMFFYFSGTIYDFRIYFLAPVAIYFKYRAKLIYCIFKS